MMAGMMRPDKFISSEIVRGHAGFVKVLATALFVAATILGCGEPQQQGVLIRLSWDNDADLDVELWQMAASSGDSNVRVLAKKTAATERVSGLSCDEELRFVPARETGSWRVAVRYWAPGPSKDLDADVKIRVTDVGGGIEELSCRMDDDSRDLWFPFEISAPDGTVQKLDRVEEGGI